MNKELASYIRVFAKAIINVMVREVPQEISGPATAAPSTCATRRLHWRAPRGLGRPAAPAADDAEIVTTPQDRPEQVVPPAAPEPGRKKDDATPPPPPPAP
jgi:hypothetical protein